VQAQPRQNGVFYAFMVPIWQSRLIFVMLLRGVMGRNSLQQHPLGHWDERDFDFYRRKRL